MCQAECTGSGPNGYCVVDSDCCPNSALGGCTSSPAGYCPVCGPGIANPCVCCNGGQCQAGGCGAPGQICTGGCGCGPCP
jgi:hypothetical protein